MELLKLWKVFPACYYISPIPKKKPSKNCFQSYVTVTLGPSLESPGHFSSQEGHSKNLEPTYDYREIFTKFFIWTEIFFVQGVSGACTSAFLDADQLKIGFTGPEKFLGLSIEKRSQLNLLVCISNLFYRSYNQQKISSFRFHRVALQWKKVWRYVTCKNMIVLFHPQGFMNTPTRK